MQASLVDTILAELVGLPYDEFDCFQLYRLFQQKLNGIEIPKHFYGDPLDVDHISQVVKDNKISYKRIQKPALGDIILLRVFGVPSHIGIYLDQDRFLHTQKQTGSIVEKLNKWEKRIIGFYRYDYHQA